VLAVRALSRDGTSGIGDLVQFWRLVSKFLDPCFGDGDRDTFVEIVDTEERELERIFFVGVG